MEKEELLIILEELGFADDGAMTSVPVMDSIAPSSHNQLRKQLSGYFKVVVKNCVVSWLRQRQRYLLRNATEDYNIIYEADACDIAEYKLYARFEDLCRDFMLDRITPDTVENVYLSEALRNVCDLDLLILNMYYAYGFTDDDIALQIGVTRQRVNYIRLGLLNTLRIQILMLQHETDNLHKTDKVGTIHGNTEYDTELNSTKCAAGAIGRHAVTRNFNTCQRKRCICNTICTRKV